MQTFATLPQPENRRLVGGHAGGSEPQRRLMKGMSIRIYPIVHNKIAASARIIHETSLSLRLCGRNRPVVQEVSGRHYGGRNRQIALGSAPRDGRKAVNPSKNGAIQMHPDAHFKVWDHLPERIPGREGHPVVAGRAIALYDYSLGILHGLEESWFLFRFRCWAVGPDGAVEPHAVLRLSARVETGRGRLEPLAPPVEPFRKSHF